MVRDRGATAEWTNGIATAVAGRRYLRLENVRAWRVPWEGKPLGEIVPVDIVGSETWERAEAAHSHTMDDGEVERICKPEMPVSRRE